VFLIDDLLGLPISGIKFVLRTLQQVAEEEYTDATPAKNRLLELQLALESGEISEEEYVRQEKDILRELREIEIRRRRMAGATAEEAAATPRLEIDSALTHENPHEARREKRGQAHKESG
jgi:hypothetical protein